MKKIVAILLWGVLLTPAWAQEKLRIGVVDVQKAINESQPGRKAKERLQIHVKKVETDLLKEKKEVEKLKGDYEKKATLMKEEERRNMEREIQRRERSYVLSGREAQEELRQRENEIIADILKDITKVITEIGKKEKYTIIFERRDVPYSDQSVDITDKVIETYNKSAPAKAAKGK